MIEDDDDMPPLVLPPPPRKEQLKKLLSPALWEIPNFLVFPEILRLEHALIERLDRFIEREIEDAIKQREGKH